MDNFYEINNDILIKYEMKKRNYQILENIKLIDNNEIFNRLKEINKVINFKDKICNIIDLSDKIIKITSKVQVVCLGGTGVGKTALIDRYIHNRFEENIQVTSTPSYSAKTEWFEEENQSIQFKIWDTSGHEKNRYFAKFLYKDSLVYILVYDVSNKNSFDLIRNYWIKQIKEYARKDVSKQKII